MKNRTKQADERTGSHRPDVDVLKRWNLPEGMIKVNQTHSERQEIDEKIMRMEEFTEELRHMIIERLTNMGINTMEELMKLRPLTSGRQMTDEQLVFWREFLTKRQLGRTDNPPPSHERDNLWELRHKRWIETQKSYKNEKK